MSFVTDWPTAQITKRLIKQSPLVFQEGDDNYSILEGRTNYNYERVVRGEYLRKQGINADASGIIDLDILSGGKSILINGAKKISGIKSSIFPGNVNRENLELGSELTLLLKGSGISVFSNQDLSSDPLAIPIMLYQGDSFTTSQPITPLEVTLFDLSDAQDGSELFWFETGGFSKIATTTQTEFTAIKSQSNAIIVDTNTIMAGWNDNELSGLPIEVFGTAKVSVNFYGNALDITQSGSIANIKIGDTFQIDFSNKLFMICTKTNRIFYFEDAVGNEKTDDALFDMHNGAQKVTDIDTSDVYYLPGKIF